MSGPLANTRQEKFAHLIAAGKEDEAAYHEAGYKGDAGNARRLRYKPHVKARIETLRAEIAAKTVAAVADRAADTAVEILESAAAAAADRAWVLEKVKKVAMICMGELPVKQTVINVLHVKDEETGKTNKVNVVQEVEVTMFNPQGANKSLELLGKANGEAFDGIGAGDAGAGADLLPKIDDDSVVDFVAHRQRNGPTRLELIRGTAKTAETG